MCCADPDRGSTPLPTGIFTPYFSNGCGVYTGVSSYPPSIELHYDAPPSPPSPPAPPSPPFITPPPLPPPPTPITMLDYNSETATYTGGCQSTYIRSDYNDRNSNYAHTTGHWWDGQSSAGNRDYVLVQFPDIFGPLADRIHMHDQISHAFLRYYVDVVFDGNAVGAHADVHEVSRAWNAQNVTYANFVGANGLTQEDFNSQSVGIALANSVGWHELDVTVSIQRWLNSPDPTAENNGCKAAWVELARHAPLCAPRNSLCAWRS